jgi:hypothetical protein
MMAKNLADFIRKLFFIRIGNSEGNIRKVNLPPFPVPDLPLSRLGALDTSRTPNFHKRSCRRTMAQAFPRQRLGWGTHLNEFECD